MVSPDMLEEAHMSSPAFVSELGVAKRPFTGRRIRWVVAAVVVLGPLLQLVEFALENPPDDNAARVATWVDQPARIGVSMAAGLLAIPFLLGGIAVLVALTRVHTARLAWAAGALLVCGMVGLAASILDGNKVGLAGVVLLVLFLGGAVLGTLSLLWPLWRTPWLPRMVALFSLAFAILDFAAGSPLISHLVNLVGLSIVAFAVVTGYSRETA
jgi:hypothetical protein